MSLDCSTFQILSNDLSIFLWTKKLPHVLRDTVILVGAALLPGFHFLSRERKERSEPFRPGKGLVNVAVERLDFYQVSILCLRNYEEPACRGEKCWTTFHSEILCLIRLNEVGFCIELRENHYSLNLEFLIGSKCWTNTCSVVICSSYRDSSRLLFFVEGPWRACRA